MSLESTEKNIYLATGIEESDVSKDIEGLQMEKINSEPELKRKMQDNSGGRDE